MTPKIHFLPLVKTFAHSRSHDDARTEHRANVHDVGLDCAAEEGTRSALRDARTTFPLRLPFLFFT